MDVVQEDGEGDVVGILLDELLDLPPVGVFLAFIVEMNNDLSTAVILVGFSNVIRTLAVTGPMPGLVLPGLFGNDLDLARHHEGGIETAGRRR